VTEVLRQAGHEADSVEEEHLSGATDETIAAVAHAGSRVLLTLDTGFGDIRNYRPAEHPGLVVLRPYHQDKRTVIALVRRLIMVVQQRPVAGELWIVESDRVRFRRG
jgi:predicted nuclease of predicted toxin-antitoxin system